MEVLLFLLGLLKIIGFILLIILAILILILLIVLFAPIKYELEGEKYSEMKGYAKISWLFGILKVKLQLNGKMDMIVAVKVFWFTIFDSSAEKKVKKQKKKKVKVQLAKKPENSKEKHKKESKQEIKRQSVENVEKSINNAEVKEKENNIDIDEAAILEHKNETINYKKENDNEKTHNYSVKIDENLNKPAVRRIKMENIEKEDIDNKDENKTHEKKEKENTSKKEELNLEYFKKMPFDEKKKVLDIILKFVKRVLKNILPRKSKIYIKFGTSDPSLTGMLLGVASVAKGVFGENLQVKANFEKVMFECEVILKGSITLVVFLYAAIRVIFEKPIWKMIKIYLKG